MDDKDGGKFHRGQPNEVGLIDKVDLVLCFVMCSACCCVF